MPTRNCRYGLLDVDIESVVRSQDIVYEDAATCWQDGHILGNGDMGAVVYAPYWLEWTINKVDVFDNRNAPKKRLTYKEVMAEVKKRGAKDLRFLREIEKPDTSKAPLEPLLKSCGQVKVRTRDNEYSWGAPQPYKVRQALSLWDATDRMDMHLKSGRWTPKPSSPRVWSFVCRQSNLMVVRMREASGAMLEEKRLELCRPYDGDLPEPHFGSEKDVVWLTQRLPDGSSYAMAMAAVPRDSRHCRKAGLKAGITGIEQMGDRIWFDLTGDFDLYVAVATSHESADALRMARTIVSKGTRTGADRLEKEHARWWAEFWRKSFIQFNPDPMLEQLWYFGLYQAASALGRAPVPGLCGLWHGHQDMPKQGFFWAVYTLDQNCQIHTLPVFCVNHPELATPFMDTFLDALPLTKKQTRAWFELPGACYGLEMGFKGGEPSFGSDYRLCLCGGPYCGIVYVWAYRYTRDKQLLREKIYPFLREIVRFWAAFMEKGEDGRYHIPLTVPAEIFTLTRDAIAPLSLLKPCLQLAIEAAELFDLDAKERRQWEDLLANYPPYPMRKGIIVDGADIPLDHPSHFTYRLYPVVLSHDDDKDVWRAVGRTLDHIAPSFRSEDGKDLRIAGWPWFFFTRARLMHGKKREMLPLLHGELYHQLKPNGLFIHMGMGRDTSENPRIREWATATPENNSTVMMIVTEMLMQSYNGLIRLFPGLVGKANARFGDLRAEGAFLVSSEMVEGKVRFVSLRAEKAGVAKVKNPWRGAAARLIRQNGDSEKLHGRILSLPLKKGETITLVPKGGRALVKKIASRRKPCPKARTFKDGTVVRLGK